MPASARRIGVTVGKFNPPHIGHLHLLETGAAQVDHLYVLLADRPDQTIPAADRAAWLSDAAPGNVTVLTTADDLPPANEPWARRALEVLPEKPSVAFTSEEWGPGWAAAMGAEHVAVDPERTAVPISSSRIREDLRSEYHWMVPAARAALARRVVAVGAESTGKTTLAKALAQHVGTVWVPEYGRCYWEGQRYLGDRDWRSSEFRHIATTHHAIEAGLASNACRALVVMDTDALVTAVWHRRYLGHDDPDLTEIAGAHRPDHYLICAPDFAWVQDGTRESNDHRKDMHDLTVELVQASGVPFDVLQGDEQHRLDHAVEIIEHVTTFEPLI